jgi:hypothetical protein
VRINSSTPPPSKKDLAARFVSAKGTKREGRPSETRQGRPPPKKLREEIKNQKTKKILLFLREKENEDKDSRRGVVAFLSKIPFRRIVLNQFCVVCVNHRAIGLGLLALTLAAHGLLYKRRRLLLFCCWSSV